MSHSKHVTQQRTDEVVDARLVVLEGPGRGRGFAIGASCVIGRSTSADVLLDDPLISRRHAEIVRGVVGHFALRDLGSSNGTFLNGRRLQGFGVLAAGDEVRVGSVVLGLTAHDPVEEQILQRQRLEVVGRLAVGVVHDLNNMLAAMGANIAYAATLDQDGRLIECLADMDQAVERATALGRRLMSFARGERRAGGSADLGNTCEEVAGLVRRTVGRQIRVVTDLEPGLAVACDSLDLHQVLMNLCLNARDAMPAGGTLRIGCRSTGDVEYDEAGLDRAVRFVTIELSDTGTGMDAATQTRVFEPFFTTKRDGAGFGMGLSTVRRIVTALGGRLALDSQLGRGTTFTIHLPAGEPGGDELLGGSVRTAATPPPRAELDCVRILVVDDERMVLTATRRLLESAGHEVVVATGGAEAVELYRASTGGFDDVILDVDMPDPAGPETLRRLLLIDGGARVVMVSGHADDALAQEVYSLGAAGFLPKPWTLQQLLDVVRRVVGSWPARPSVFDTVEDPVTTVTQQSRKPPSG